jgi:hypothetical protein
MPRSSAAENPIFLITWRRRVPVALLIQINIAISQHIILAWNKAEYILCWMTDWLEYSFVFTDVAPYRLARSYRSPFFRNVQQAKKCDIPGLLQSELDNTILRNVGNF